MTHPAEVRRSVIATVQEVLPQLGLAYASDGDERLWGITRSMPGGEIGSLHEGVRIALTIEEHGPFELASGWAPL